MAKSIEQIIEERVRQRMDQAYQANIEKCCITGTGVENVKLQNANLIPWKSAADPRGIDTGKEYLVRWPDGKVRQGEWYPFWRLWIDQLGDSFHPQPRWYVGMEELPGPGGDK